MIYQEINLPIWAQLVIMVLLILIGIEIAKIKLQRTLNKKPKKHAQTMLKSVTGLYSITGTILQLRRHDMKLYHYSQFTDLASIKENGLHVGADNVVYLAEVLC